MSQVIRHVSQLPRWFSLSNYAAQQQLSLKDWLRQLSVRAELQDAARPLVDFHREDQALIRQDPIVRAPVGREEHIGRIRWVDAQVQGQEDQHQFVRPMTLVDHIVAVDMVGAAEYQRHAEAWRILFNATEPSPEALAAERSWPALESSLASFAAPTTAASMAHVVVDLEVADELLIRSFTQLLPALRRAASARSQDTAAENLRIDPGSWCRFAVLPYLDLRQWAVEEGLRIPNRVMADAIFEPGEGGEEVVRKTTTKLAAAVTSDAFLDRLMVAAFEQIRNA